MPTLSVHFQVDPTAKTPDGRTAYELLASAASHVDMRLFGACRLAYTFEQALTVVFHDGGTEGLARALNYPDESGAWRTLLDGYSIGDDLGWGDGMPHYTPVEHTLEAVRAAAGLNVHGASTSEVVAVRA